MENTRELLEAAQDLAALCVEGNLRNMYDMDEQSDFEERLRDAQNELRELMSETDSREEFVFMVRVQVRNEEVGESTIRNCIETTLADHFDDEYGSDSDSNALVSVLSVK